MSRRTAVDDRCISALWELKGKREVNTVICRLSDALDTCVVERQGNLTHDELLSALPAHEPRLVVHDLAFATADGARRNRILLISWLPRGITPSMRLPTVTPMPLCSRGWTEARCPCGPRTWRTWTTAASFPRPAQERYAGASREA